MGSFCSIGDTTICNSSNQTNLYKNIFWIQPSNIYYPPLASTFVIDSSTQNSSCTWQPEIHSTLNEGSTWNCFGPLTPLHWTRTTPNKSPNHKEKQSFVLHSPSLHACLVLQPTKHIQWCHHTHKLAAISHSSSSMSVQHAHLLFSFCSLFHWSCFPSIFMVGVPWQVLRFHAFHHPAAVGENFCQDIVLLPPRNGTAPAKHSLLKATQHSYSMGPAPALFLTKHINQLLAQQHHVSHPPSIPLSTLLCFPG